MSIKNRDYREFEKTLVGFLDAKKTDSNELNIKSISDKIEEIQELPAVKDFVKECIKDSICNEHLSVSNNYYRKFCHVIDSLTNKDAILRYLYNIYLCGRGLSLSSIKK